MSLAIRLAKGLLRFAQIDPDNIQPAGVAITQRELSEMVGVSRENANKQLRIWEKRRWIQLGRGKIKILDPAALLRLSENDASDDDGG